MSDKPLRVFNEAAAVITDGAPGIGRALAEKLARCGSEVSLADLQVELAEAAASSIGELVVKHKYPHSMQLRLLLGWPDGRFREMLHERVMQGNSCSS